ncbi:PREDICTED: ferredoxin-fold anticodon-binding domain-containing protein 1 homolog isoform X2 [Priapulus caudatus]|uniref:Ferredoxin-fold anticodon-binding domain-containing protein 1 homolog isoform X2 n=1 Tax=Priapulus caudatus TaxID=37621 RepID=A0ABM1DNR8_PRICU|nr:PREDICTED: ferredoxin-fold anticodon-binding domain-containing protein 1 homolog isoform X2 [Priapulus caudatus]
MGAEVMCGVDATKLPTVFPIRKMDRIIFNFPHIGGKSNVKKNRRLLRDFFESAAEILTPHGDVCVTLCQGQGGSPADIPMREWHNTWQVIAMAACANLVLYKCRPFLPSEYPNYNCTGFRSQDKAFHTRCAITHYFRHGVPFTFPEPSDERDCNIHDVCTRKTYTCSSSYLAECVRRKLHEEVGHPIQQIACHMTKVLADSTKYRVDVVSGSELPLVLSATTVPPQSIRVLPATDNGPSGETREHFLRSSAIDLIPALLQRKATRSACSNTDGGATGNVAVVENVAVDVAVVEDVSVIEDIAVAGDVAVGSSTEVPWLQMCVVDVYHEEAIYSEPLAAYELIILCDGSPAAAARDCLQTMLPGGATHHCVSTCLFPSPSSTNGAPSVNNVPSAVTTEQSENLHQRSPPWLRAFRVTGGRHAAFVIDVAAACTATVGVTTDQRVLRTIDPRVLAELRDTPPGGAAPAFWHDVSFWRPDDYDERDFFRVIRDMAAPLVNDVSLLEEYVREGRTSLCYRVVYQSCDHPLPQQMAARLQSALRLRLIDELRYELRPNV